MLILRLKEEEEEQWKISLVFEETNHNHYSNLLVEFETHQNFIIQVKIADSNNYVLRI